VNYARGSTLYEKNSSRYGLIADDDVLSEEFPELVNWKPEVSASEAIYDTEGPNSGSLAISAVSASAMGISGIDTTAYIGMLHGVIKELITAISGSTDFNELKAAVT